MPRSGPRTVRKYSDEFKLMAVRMSQLPAIQVKTVGAALEIHPFTLSRWRKEMRDGVVRGRVPKAPPPGVTRERARLQDVERKVVAMQEEHELVKQAIHALDARHPNRIWHTRVTPPNQVDV